MLFNREIVCDQITMHAIVLFVGNNNKYRNQHGIVLGRTEIRKSIRPPLQPFGVGKLQFDLYHRDHFTHGRAFVEKDAAIFIIRIFY